jgi:hypothetical protein
MRHLPTLCLTLAATPFLAAQTRVSPLGAQAVEGGGTSSIPWVYAAARAQQADGDLIGSPLAITKIAFRRDGTTSSTTAVARTIDVTLLMGDTSLASFGTTFASNFLNAPTTVFARRSVNFPDWTTPPTSRPMPFSLTFTLDAPYAHNGQNALLLELRGENSTAAGSYAMDWINGASTAYGAAPSALGTGCTTPNGTFTHTSTLTASATTANLGFGGSGAPAATQVYLLLGLVDPNLAVPGLCANLRTDAALALPLRVSTAGGSVTTTTLTTPWQPSFAGVRLFTQLAAADGNQPGLPLALSNGLASPLPSGPGLPAPTNQRRIYNLTSVTTPTGTGLSTTAVPIQYN